MITNKNPRLYEITLWTLQDSFIAILKGFNADCPGSIEDPELTLSDDSEDRFSFKLPMYIRQNGEYKENPIWYNTVNGNLIANLRKLKLVFHKGYENQRVFEFIITNVKESHEGFEKYCDVEAEGLAFNELGKTGYNINLSQEIYEEEYRKDETIVNNINYWLDKVLPPSFSWNYRINMNWDDYYGEDRQSDKIYEDGYIENWEFNNEGKLIPTNIIKSTEKLRLVDASGSNRYNLTQTIAETFGVYCRYIYDYDDNLHIIGKTVEFYNNSLKEDEEILDFTYYYNTEDISREMDSADQVTKMFVLSGDGEELLNSSIIDVASNKTLENYLLNFDYLYTIDGLDDDQKEYIEDFEGKIREINLLLKQLSNKIMISQNVLNTFKAKRDSASLMQQQAAEAMEDEYAYIKHLYQSDSIDYDQQPQTLSITGLNPDPVTIITDEEENNKYCNIYKDGVIPNSIIVFTSMAAANSFHKALYGTSDTRNLIVDITEAEGIYTVTITQNGVVIATEIKNTYNEAYEYAANEVLKKNGDYLSTDSYKVVIDPETNFATGLEHINYDDEKQILYLVYNYSLDLYHKVLYDNWKKIQLEQLQLYDNYSLVVNKLDGIRDQNDEWTTDDHGLLQRYLDLYDEALEQKEIILLDFENYLGPALREGTWSPEEDYTKYGDKRIDDLSLNKESEFTDITSIGWDSCLFAGERKNYDQDGLSQEDKTYYPCIKLTDDLRQAIFDAVEDGTQLGDIGFVWDDTAIPGINELSGEALMPLTYPQIYRIGSELEIGFIRKKEGIDTNTIPVLMLVNPNAYCSSYKLIYNTDESETEIYQKLNGCIGILTVEETEINDISHIEYRVTRIYDEDLDWISDETLSSYERVYPRIRIPYSTFIENNDDCKIKIKIDEDEYATLKPYYDYNIMTRYDIISDNGNIVAIDDLDFWSSGDNDQSNFDNAIFSYYVTIKPDIMIKNNLPLIQTDAPGEQNVANYGEYKFLYKLSNTALATYLDAVDVLKENSIPKVTYSITPIVLKLDFMDEAYDRIHTIININDPELKFENVQGYISSLTLKLDEPWEDSFDVKNYTAKFEDLFSSIVASTATIEKNASIISSLSSSFSSTGEITAQVLQDSIDTADLVFKFSNDNFVIDDSGIKAYNDNGIIYYSNQGIFTATEQDNTGTWQWNTSITSAGINANSITTGRLDTNLIRVYSGDNLRFQLNGDGLYAYKSWLTQDMSNVTGQNAQNALEAYNNSVRNRNGLDPAQYVVMNSDGLFLTAKKGAYIINDDNEPIEIQQDVDRVEISWEGLVLRNNNNEKTFFADPDTGNLNIRGNITINGDYIDAELSESSLRFGTYELIKTEANNSECLSFIYTEEREGGE